MYTYIHIYIRKYIHTYERLAYGQTIGQTDTPITNNAYTHIQKMAYGDIHTYNQT